MKEILVKDIIRVCEGKLLNGDENFICRSFSKDTRTIKENDVYIGIKGDNFNGNLFYEEAFNKKAALCILDDDTKINDCQKPIILVKNTIKALQKLATYKRNMYDIPVIAITGSVGKTSTKDLIYSTLKTKYNVLKTEGNYNNYIGLPLTILKLKSHEVLVVEMGMNSLGEISLLSKIVRPTIGIITNVGTSHIGKLQGRENILKAKLEILDGMTKDSTLIINNDNDLLHKNINTLKSKINLITIGIDEKSDYNASDIKYDLNSSSFMVENNHLNITSPSKGFVYNSLMAYVVGVKMGLSPSLIEKGLKECELTSNRLETHPTKKGFNLIDDSYNANFDGMALALETLGRYQTRKIAVLGDMFELGEYSEEIHKLVGEEANKNNIDVLITIGNDSKFINDIFKKEKIHFNQIEDSYDYLSKLIKPTDTVLIKASNGMKFHEKLGTFLENI